MGSKHERAQLDIPHTVQAGQRSLFPVSLKTPQYENILKPPEGNSDEQIQIGSGKSNGRVEKGSTNCSAASALN